ncbi:MAG: ABC transporter ATP-binding protein [Pseudomonadota bacterium]
MTLDDVKLYLPIGRQTLSAIFSPPRDGGKDPRFITQRGGRYCKALDGVSVNIKSGDRVGLVGPNGAGKSSLLRVLAGIYAPTDGAIDLQGRVSTLFTPNIGMNDNASGVENIYISARTLGMSRAHIKSVTEDIIEFADLGDFINLPMRTYSAGMKMRLGFAIATAIEPDILLVDEVFGAGDAAFRERARARMSRLMSRAGIIVLATHSDGVIREFCNRILWLENGRVRFDGETAEGLKLFAAHNKKAPTKKAAE